MAAELKRPTYEVMVKETVLLEANRNTGVSIRAISKIVTGKYGIEEANATKFIKVAVKRMLEANTLVQVKGVGLAGSFKLNSEIQKAERKARAKKQVPHKAVEKKIRDTKAKVKPTKTTEVVKKTTGKIKKVVEVEKKKTPIKIKVADKKQTGAKKSKPKIVPDEQKDKPVGNVAKVKQGQVETVPSTKTITRKMNQLALQRQKEPEPKQEAKKQEEVDENAATEDEDEDDAEEDISTDEDSEDKENQPPKNPPVAAPLEESESETDEEVSDSDDILRKVGLPPDKVKCNICRAVVTLKGLPRHKLTKLCMNAAKKNVA